MISFLKEHRDFPFQLSLVLVDIVLIIISFMIAYYLRYRVPGIPGPGFLAYQKSILIVIPLWIGIFIYFGLYRIRRSWRNSEVVFNSALAVSVGMVLYLAVSYMLKEFFFSRLLLISLWGSNILLISCSRLAFRYLLLKVRRRGIGIRKVLVIGNTSSSKMISKIIDLHPELGYKIVGYLTAEGTGEPAEAGPFPKKSVLGTTKTILREAKSLKPDEVFFTISLGKREELWAMVNSFQRDGVEVRIIPDIYEFFSTRMIMDDLEGVPTIRFRPITMRTWEQIFKLGLDYLGSIILLIVFSPVLLYVFLRLRAITSDGILMKETVVGQFGHPFEIYRFRIPLEVVLTDPDQETAPTSFGRFLYRYSFSDLPQLLNVLKGEMSLVGPRPEPPSRVERYNEWHRRRLLIKPGITGLAQVNGLRGFRSSDEKTHFDIQYMESHSVLLDLTILLQTVWVLLKRHKQPLSFSLLQST